MTNPSLTRRIALCMGGLAIAGMGLTVGCSAKESPAPTAPVDSSVDSKRPPQKDSAENKQSKPQNSFGPAVKAPSAPTASPGDN